MSKPVVLEPCNPEWRLMFEELGRKLRKELGAAALRIDHVGSTSVPGLLAKPIIDVQVSVEAFEPMDLYQIPLERLGFHLRERSPDLTKRYFRESSGERETHIHVRKAGSFSEQCSLLFRDYLRAHEEDAARYAEEKKRLAEVHRDDRLQYTEAKGLIIWQIIAKAHQWAQLTGWEPGPSDA